MKWTLVRYRTKPDRADENQRLSEAVFRELSARMPQGLGYAVLRLPDDTFVHLATLEDGADGLATFDSFKAFQTAVRERCLEPPLFGAPTVVGNYRLLDDTTRR